MNSTSMSSSNVMTEAVNNKVLPSDKSGLPWELWQIILSWLSAADLCRVACVCKTWTDLVISVDSTRWKELYLACSEWRHPFWPLNTHAEPPSWRLAYRDQYISTKFWCRRRKHETRTMSCSVMFKKNVPRRDIHVGPGYEHTSLKTALSVANDYDRVVVHPGIYDEQFEISAKIPFELIGDGELGSVILVVGIQQLSTTARLSNLVLRAPWFTSFIAIINSGYLQIDNCILEDGMICAQNPSTVHIKFCTFRHASVVLHHMNASIIENCEFSQSGSANIFIEGHPKDEKNWTYSFLRDRTNAIYHQKRSLHRKKHGLKPTTSLTSTLHSSFTGKSLLTGYSNPVGDLVSHDPSYSFDDPGASFLNHSLLGPCYLGSERDGMVGCGDLQSMYQESVPSLQPPTSTQPSTVPGAALEMKKPKQNGGGTHKNANSSDKSKSKIELSKDCLLLPEVHAKDKNPNTTLECPNMVDKTIPGNKPSDQQIVRNTARRKSLGSSSLQQLDEEKSVNIVIASVSTHEEVKNASDNKMVKKQVCEPGLYMTVAESADWKCPKHSALKKFDRRKSVDSHVEFRLDESDELAAVNQQLGVDDGAKPSERHSFSSQLHSGTFPLSNTDSNSSEVPGISEDPHDRNKGKHMAGSAGKGKQRRRSFQAAERGQSNEAGDAHASTSKTELPHDFSKTFSNHLHEDPHSSGLQENCDIVPKKETESRTGLENLCLSQSFGENEGVNSKTAKAHDQKIRNSAHELHIHLHNFPDTTVQGPGSSDQGFSSAYGASINNNSNNNNNNNNNISTFNLNSQHHEGEANLSDLRSLHASVSHQPGPSRLNSVQVPRGNVVSGVEGRVAPQLENANGEVSHHPQPRPMRRSQSEEVLPESDDDLSILDELDDSAESSDVESDAPESLGRSTDSSDIESLHFTGSDDDFSSSEESVIMLPHLREFQMNQRAQSASPRGVEAEIASINSECTRPVPVNVSEDTLMSSYVGQIQGCLIHQCRMNHSKGGVMISLQAHAIISECDISNVGYGIRCIQNSRVVILKNKIHHCRTSGVFMRLAASGLIAGNDIHSNNEAGIDIRKNADPLVQFNQIHHGKRSGVVVLGSGRGQIKKNDIYSNAEAGVYVLYGGNPTISENYIYEGRAAGVAINAGGKGCVVDNVIRANQWGGIDIRNGSCPLVSGNSIINGISDGIVVGAGGKGSIENNFISGNSGCGIWTMAAKNLYIHGNQICNSGHCGVMMLDKSSSSMDGHIGQLVTNVSHRTYSQYDDDFPVPEPQTSWAVLQYNNIYHNKGQGIFIEIGEEVRMFYNAVHANQKDGIFMSQDAPTVVEGNSITSNNGNGIITSTHDKTRLCGNGIYDNTQNGVVCRNHCVMDENDIVGQAVCAVLVEGKGQAQVTKTRLSSSSVAAIKGEESSVITATNNKIFDRGGGDFSSTGKLTANDNVLVRPTLLTRKSSRSEFNKTDFLTDPPPRPHIPPPPSSTTIPTHHVTVVTKVTLPSSDSCEQGSRLCAIL